MASSMLEAQGIQRPTCPRCGHPMEPRPRNTWIETGSGILAAVALLLLLIPLGIMAWKSCRDILCDLESHSILYHPLEDWTRY